MKCKNPSCNKIFKPKHFNQEYCSVICRERMHYRTKNIRKCLTCDKEFFTYAGKRKNVNKFCSNKCSPAPNYKKSREIKYWTNKKWLTENYQNKVISISRLAKNIETSRNTLTYWLNHFKIPIKPKSTVQAGKNNPYFGKNHPPEIRQKMQGDRPSVCGENNPAWRGGNFPYYGPDWQINKRLARERDNHTCQACGKQQTNRELDVHHIVPYRITKDNSLNNLVTLCQPCHRKQSSHLLPIPSSSFY